MGLYSEFDLINDFGFTEATEEYHIVPNYSEGCHEFVATFLRVATDLVPVDTGYLKSTLKAKSDGHSFCWVETICEYAQYVEYGTYKQRAQPYFEPALEAALNAAWPLWAQAEDEAWEEEEDLIEEAEEEAARQAERAASSRTGGGGSLNMSSLGSLFGSLLAVMITAVIMFALSNLFGSQKDPHISITKKGIGGSQGEIFMPPVEII